MFSRPLSDRGATLAEYALLVALVSVTSVGALEVLGNSTSAGIEDAASRIGVAEGGPSEPPSPPSPPTAPPREPGGGGGAGGGGGSGGGASPTTTSTVPPSTVPPTTQPPAVTTTTTPPPPVQSGWDANSTRRGNKWGATGTVTIYGTDGKPLDLPSAQVQIRVVREYRTWDGHFGEQSHLTQASISSDGKATFVDDGHSMPAPGTWHTYAVRYEVVQVFYYYPSNPAVRWDGHQAEVRVLAP